MFESDIEEDYQAVAVDHEADIAEMRVRHMTVLIDLNDGYIASERKRLSFFICGSMAMTVYGVATWLLLESWMVVAICVINIASACGSAVLSHRHIAELREQNVECHRDLRIAQRRVQMAFLKKNGWITTTNFVVN